MSAERSRLVVAISDLTETSEIVVQHASRIAHRLNARLRIVHPLGAIGESLRKALFGTPPLQQRIETASRRLAQQLDGVLANTTARCEAVLDHHHAHEVIFAQAQSGVTDIVVAGHAFAATLPIELLARTRTPCLFVPETWGDGSRCVIQALSQSMTPDSFLRAQRWLRILQSLSSPLSAQPMSNGELLILLCPDLDEDAAAATERAAATLRETLHDPVSTLAVALLPPPEHKDSTGCAARLHAVLTAESRCPLLIMPALPALRAVWTPPAFSPISV